MAYLENTRFYIDASAIKPNLPKVVLLNNNMISLNEIVQNIIAGTSAADNFKVFLQTTAPLAADSTTGDVYINTDSGRVYQYDGTTWTSKYNPAVITENKSFTYSTYNKSEGFTTGNFAVSTTDGNIKLSRSIGDNTYHIDIENNGFIDAVTLSRVDGTAATDLKSVVVADSGVYINSSPDSAVSLTQVSLTDTTATMQFSDISTPANSSRVYTGSGKVYIGGVSVDIGVAGDLLDIGTTLTKTNNLTIHGDDIILDGTLPTAPVPHSKLVIATSNDAVTVLPLIQNLIQVSASGNITVAKNDTPIEVNATGADVTLVLPAGTLANAGVKYYLFNLATSTHNLLVDTDGTDFLNGNNSTNMTVQPGRGVMITNIASNKWFTTFI